MFNYFEKIGHVRPQLASASYAFAMVAKILTTKAKVQKNSEKIAE